MGQLCVKVHPPFCDSAPVTEIAGVESRGIEARRRLAEEMASRDLVQNVAKICQDAAFFSGENGL